MAALPDRQRAALVLVHFEGLGNLEAAEALGVSVEAVESLLARARRSLKQAFADRWRELVAEFSDL
jgi:RNA polymerase sigma-70 factor (ECF subfamily)